ncbi:hypothetical protein ACPCBF_30485 [Streptomyces pseudogriseolus]|uniref:hypothetical protein n=1 Tax=Streptomyces pseudogriseolus TaxID=36817 RepID=UPI0034809EFF
MDIADGPGGGHCGCYIKLPDDLKPDHFDVPDGVADTDGGGGGGGGGCGFHISIGGSKLADIDGGGGGGGGGSGGGGGGGGGGHTGPGGASLADKQQTGGSDPDETPYCRVFIRD